MKFKSRVLLAISCVCLAAMPASGAKITDFRVYTNFGSLPSTPLVGTYTDSNANLSNATFSCLSSSPCFGRIALLFGATGYDLSQTLLITFAGNLSGTQPGSGAISFGGNATYPTLTFSFDAGNFNTTIAREQFSTPGVISDISFFTLTLPANQVLTLTGGLNLSFVQAAAPVSLLAQPTSVPEPGSRMMLGVGFGALVIFGFLTKLRRAV